jgi:hypothetical protein
VLDGGAGSPARRARARSRTATRRTLRGCAPAAPASRSDRRPRPPYGHPVVRVRGHAALRRCAFPAAPAWRARSRSADAAARVPGIETARPTTVLPRDLCPAVIGDVLVYRNSGTSPPAT